MKTLVLRKAPRNIGRKTCGCSGMPSAERDHRCGIVLKIGLLTIARRASGNDRDFPSQSLSYERPGDYMIPRLRYAELAAICAGLTFMEFAHRQAMFDTCLLQDSNSRGGVETPID